MRRVPLLRPLFAAIVLFGAPLGAQASVSSGAEARGVRGIEGRVFDATAGRPIDGARVSIAAPGATPRLTTSAASGKWRVDGLGDGAYTLTIRAVGFTPHEQVIAVRDGRVTGPESFVIRLQPVPHALDQVVVTAARREQRLADAIVTTEVVSRADIARTGASDLAAVLTEQTGIHFQEGHPSGAGVMLQGLGAERVLVLMDGQPVVGRISGNFDLSRIPVAMVERVEVVKGPQSTLYGSEAMGGVINIVTRGATADQWSGTASVTGGSDQRRDGTLGATVGRGPWGATVDAGMRTVDRTPGRTESAGALAERMDLATKLRWSPDATRSIEATALVLSERQRWGSGTLFDFADNRQIGGRVSGSLNLGEHRLTPTVYLSQFEHRSRRSRGAVPIAGTGDQQTQRLAEAELLYSGRVVGRVVDAGVEVRQEYIGTTDGRIDGGSRTLYSAEPFAQLEFAGDNWSVVPGARLTWNEQWGSYLTPRVAARWQLSAPLTLRASVGRGFRAPDFKELYLAFTNDNAGYAVYGNPLLRPESSNNLTGGLEWTGATGFVRGQLFYNELRDFIETRPLAASGPVLRYEYGNVDEGLTAGADVEAGAAFGPLRMELGYSRLIAEDRNTGQSLLGRPAHSGRIMLGASLPFRLRGSITGVYTGETPMQRDEAGAITSTRDAFLRFDARIAQPIPGGLELILGADNLFDQQPAQWAGATGRQLYTGLAWNFARDLQ